MHLFFLPKPRVSLFLILFAFSLWYLYAHCTLHKLNFSRRMKKKTANERSPYNVWMITDACIAVDCLFEAMKTCMQIPIFIVDLRVCWLSFELDSNFISILLLYYHQFAFFFPSFLHLFIIFFLALRSFYRSLLVNFIFAIFYLFLVMKLNEMYY